MFNRCTEDLEPRLSCDRETYSRHLSKESADGGARIQYEHCGTQTTCAQRDPVKLQICGLEDTVTAAVCAVVTGAVLVFNYAQYILYVALESVSCKSSE